MFTVKTNCIHFQPVRHPQPPEAELTVGCRPYSRLVKASARWWKISGCPSENILDVASILWIFRHPVYSPDLPCQDGYQCFHHSHFLDHCDSPGDQSFSLPHHRQITNDHLLDHHCTRASHLSDESILATLNFQWQTLLDTGFSTEHVEKANPTSMWVIFQDCEKFPETAKGIICGGLSIWPVFLC